MCAPSMASMPADAWRSLFPAALLPLLCGSYSGFLVDRFTLLSDTADRVLASNLTATWK